DTGMTPDPALPALRPAARLGDRALFPDLVPRAYLNHAAMSPPSLPVRDAVAAALDAYAREGIAAMGRYAEQREELRVRLAALLGAAPADIGLVPNTSHGVLAVAHCLPWRHGERVVLLRGEFPANVTPWQRVAELHGLELEWLDADAFARGGPGLGQLEGVLRRGVRLVAVSAVQFQTGLRMPLRAIGELCHRHGAEVFVDVIQAVGAVPLRVGDGAFSYLAAGSHTWLMGIDGAGFLWISPERIAALRPRIASWLSHEDPLRFLVPGGDHLRYDRPIRARADFVELGVMGALSYAALHTAVGILLDLGVPAIFAHVQRLLDRLDEGLRALGCTSARAADPAERSCIL